ncbi:MAG TPA: SUMF1/EgtB/PvdO family nonheme iron enzyme [Anaerolineaceae bacterium]|nr:SUMF1/EgtB/PvdO family nonheme iron enzyme [Anaerolineaceae bacterium]
MANSTSTSLTSRVTKTISEPVMIQIPEGPFFMGTSDQQIENLLANEDWAQEWYDKDLFTSEQPYHELNLPGYDMAKYPVTNLEYFQFIMATGHRAPRGWAGFHYLDGTEEFPVVGVSLQDAITFIKWMNGLFNRDYRIPTEAEWEKAARGPDGRVYPWGDDFDPWRCNTDESGKRAPSPIGSYSPGGDSQYGVTDMAGNVWEWTISQFMPYPYNPNDGREVRKPTTKLAVRGGAWYYSRKLARCASREGVLADYVSGSLGFRLCRKS